MTNLENFLLIYGSDSLEADLVQRGRKLLGDLKILINDLRDENKVPNLKGARRKIFSLF